jgi:hypothetical protein
MSKIVLILTCAIAVSTLRADSITVQELASGLSIRIDGARALGNCAENSCFFAFIHPDNVRSSWAEPQGSPWIGVVLQNWEEVYLKGNEDFPRNPFVETGVFGISQVFDQDLYFSGVYEKFDTLQAYNDFTGDRVFEDGTTQKVANYFWLLNDNTSIVDTLYFQAAVPEPMSVALFGTVIALLIVIRYRKARPLIT